MLCRSCSEIRVRLSPGRHTPEPGAKAESGSFRKIAVTTVQQDVRDPYLRG